MIDKMDEENKENRINIMKQAQIDFLKRKYKRTGNDKYRVELQNLGVNIKKP